MEKLIKILEQFDQERKRTKRHGSWDETALVKIIHPLAKEILCNGCFLVNGKFIIDIGVIELYYHEENGEIKDHVMYHTNEHFPKSFKEIIKHNGGYPYFEIGSFNQHSSGIDITFENEENKYRASFLIRSYRLLERKDLNNNDILYDPYSTHIFDDMFFGGLLLSTDKRTTIEWIEYDKGGEIEQCPRKNVALYNENGDKIDTTEAYYKIAKKEAEENKSYPKCFKYGTKFFMQDMRPWQFKLKGIKEKK